MKMVRINKYAAIFTGLVMHDVMDIVKNIENIYDSNNAFNVLKDFERVLDELDLYVYTNWIDGELAMGPDIERHWVTCAFMWPKKSMPDPMGGKRLVDYDCKVRFKKDTLIKPRKIEEPGDIRPGSKKGKLDRQPIWIVEIQMPKKLITDIYLDFHSQQLYVKVFLAKDLWHLLQHPLKSIGDTYLDILS